MTGQVACLVVAPGHVSDSRKHGFPRSPFRSPEDRDRPIAGHRFIVDVIFQPFGDIVLVLGGLLHEVFKTFVFTKIAFFDGLAGLCQTPEVIDQLRTEPAMLRYELRLLHDLLNNFVFSQAQPFKTFIVVYGVFFRSLNRGGFEHFSDI
tara:strand:- start:6288 stop:6734 length:447 start_codon:yes stop_codon:yes gene_type:complete